MANRKARNVFRDRPIPRVALTLISILRVLSRMRGVAVVGIDDVASAAPTAAIVTRMIGGTEEPQTGIEKTGFLETQEDRIGPSFGAVTPDTQAIVAALENPQ